MHSSLLFYIHRLVVGLSVNWHVLQEEASLIRVEQGTHQ